MIGAHARASMTPGTSWAAGQDLGPAPFTITAAVFRAELQRVRANVDMLAIDVARQAALLPPETRRAWTDFVMRWGAFYNDHKDVGNLGHYFFSRTSYEQTFDFEREANVFRADLQRRGGTITAPPPTPSHLSPSAPEDKGASPFVWGLLIVGGIFAVGYAARAFGQGPRSSE